MRKSASGRPYAYDLNSNLTHQKDVTRKVMEYAYNVLDLLEKVTDNGNTVAEYAYYPDGSRKSLANGSLHTEYPYVTAISMMYKETLRFMRRRPQNRYNRIKIEESI